MTATQADTPELPGADEATWELERAHAWAKLYGYVRWFHPSDEIAAADMDAWACHGAAAIQEASDPAALQEVLSELVAPLAPTAQIWLEGEPAPAPVELPESDDWTAWQHHGWGHSNSNVYTSVRAGRTAARPVPGDPFVTVTQSVEVAELRGRRVRLSADVRIAAGSRLQIWMKSTRPYGTDVERSEPIWELDWTPYSVEMLLAEDAETLTVGAYLVGDGEGWLDEVVLEVEEDGGWSELRLKGADFERQRVRGWDVEGEGYHWGTRWLPSDMRRGLRLWRETVSVEPAFDVIPEPGGDVYALGGGLTARVPLLLPDDGATLPKSKLTPPPMPPCDDASELSTRLAVVAVGWNILQHFYPYFEVVDVDWEAQLDDALQGALDGAPLMETMSLMVAALQDGHGHVHSPEPASRGSLPVAVRRVEGALVVLSSADERVRRGDVLTAVDGVSAGEHFEARLAHLSGSTQFKEAIGAEHLSWGAVGESVSWSLVREAMGDVSEQGEREPAEPATTEVTLSYGDVRPPPLTERSIIETLDDGVMVVDLNRVPWEALEAALDELAAAPGVVFDLRAYPGDDVYQILNHLLTEADDHEWMHIPQINRPDGVVAGWSPAGWSLEPAKPHIGGEVVFLVSGRAISYAESVLGFVEGYSLGELVGGPSAGANGNVNTSPLPAGWHISWTGMKVLKHDGSQQHLTGVTPTISAVRTMAGVREGRDEVLERGLEVVRQRTAESSAGER